MALVLLSLVYGAITFQQPSVFAVCLDIGNEHAGVVTGSMNTAGQLGSLASSVMFGYLAKNYGYTAPFIPMAILLFIGALLWLKIDPSRKLISEPDDLLKEVTDPRAGA